MSKSFCDFCKSTLFIAAFNVSIHLHGDSFDNLIYNNHGSVGLINIPTARFFNESIHGITMYDGTPDQKITLSSNPYNWMEASFFYTNVQGYPYPNYEYQDYKDKGFNLKLRLKEEGVLPALAFGFYDFAGTGMYSSEYIVSSYGIDNLDIHFGLGWGRLNQEDGSIKNPLSYINKSFKKRPLGWSSGGGQFEFSKFFSGETATPFYGVAYKYNKNLILKIERDTLSARDFSTPLRYEENANKYSFGFDYLINSNFSLGAAFERGNYFSLKFVYKNNPKKSTKKYSYKKPDINESDDKYYKLIKSLEKNGIGVKKISESTRSIGLELTQFIHPNLNIVNQIISQASIDAGIEKNIKKNIKIADLTAVEEIDASFEKNAQTIYERNSEKSINTSTGIRFRPFLASREEFFKGALLLENDTEFVLKDNLFLSTNLKYNL